MNGTSSPKSDLRREVRREKKSVPKAALDRWSAAVCRRLERHPVLTRAKTVLMYSPLPDEPDIRPLVGEFHAAGKRVLLPKVTGEGTMDFILYTGEDSLRTGAFGILEPSGEAFTDLAAVAAAVIPGMAFSTDGRRLGRGKGYYDRALSAMPDTYKIGVCFPFQLKRTVPSDAWDVAMDEVVSDKS